MPAIYDNIEQQLVDGLLGALDNGKRADFCVGFFNLRGWGAILPAVKKLKGEEGYPPCRLIIGMLNNPDETVRRHYGGSFQKVTQGDTPQLRRDLINGFVKQLTRGHPTKRDQIALRNLAKQLREGQLKVKFFMRHPLHAKLYLAHREDNVASLMGFVGSSNLTFAGLEKNGELNVDVLDQDVAEKLAKWFNARWDDEWSIDVSEDIAKVIEDSWVDGPIEPYHIYIKTAYHLSREAIEGANQFQLPREFAGQLLDFQVQAVALAAERLNRENGVIIGDVVGLGKTRVASAVAKTFQEDQNCNVLVVCPPKLEKMWKEHLLDFNIAGEVLSLGKVNSLENMRRFRLLIVDESHNFRNRKSSRYSFLRNYIHDNDSRAILLTATPYNKAYADIASQLRLFVDPGADLGMRPEACIAMSGGTTSFKEKHPNTLISSLAAFEHSEEIDDWRELMRRFMVRRTREHIKANYAKEDSKKGLSYLTFSNRERFYFPRREPRHISFDLQSGDGDDQYALLYSKAVIDTIGELTLPRYGLKGYLNAAAAPPDKKESEVIDNLSRAGSRLRGFLRARLFKRLESCGPSFLLSVRRHILHNALMMHALDSDGHLPIGQIDPSFVDDALEDDEIFAGTDVIDEGVPDGLTLDSFIQAGASLHKFLRDKQIDKFSWIRSDLFLPKLERDLRKDCEKLLRILKSVPEWDADNDRKLRALVELCKAEHGEDKIIIFTEFADTAKYLDRELHSAGVESLGLAHGGIDNIGSIVRRFSPRSNGAESEGADELRVLVATDVLSEGQNLQDAHVVVNFDLPWAIIRLVQRAGRVDRIGQKADTIYCYSALPEDSIEQIIALRKRLRQRMLKNAELVGSDERFFEGDVDGNNLRRVYEDRINLEEEEDETDLISRAFDIWNQATKSDPALKKKIENLQDGVYSAMKSDDEGAIVYIKDNRDCHILALVDTKGNIVSQSQSRLLGLLECKPDTQTATESDNHLELVSKTAEYFRDSKGDFGGQLGGKSSVRHRVYFRLMDVLQKEKGGLLENVDGGELKSAVSLILSQPLKESARDKFGRQLKAGIHDQELANMARNLFRAGDLCLVAEGRGEVPETHIICSMGLVK